MPTGPAARITDDVVHPTPPKLSPGPASPDVFIGYLKAWRGVPASVAAALQGPKQTADTAIKSAVAATAAATGPGVPIAYAAEQATKAAALLSMSALILSSAAGADIHACMTPLPIPVHGPGVVIDGSKTVQINFLAACRLGDTILEAAGPMNKIAKGERTVIIGD